MGVGMGNMNDYELCVCGEKGRAGCLLVLKYLKICVLQFYRALRSSQQGAGLGRGGLAGGLQCDAALFGTLDAHTHTHIHRATTASWANNGNHSSHTDRQRKELYACCVSVCVCMVNPGTHNNSSGSGKAGRQAGNGAG